MKLTDLNPRWTGAGGPGIHNADGSPTVKRSGVGMTCDCPCGCGARLGVMFENPIDGGIAWHGGAKWKRTGDTFETLTLKPSILNSTPGACGWHGYLTGGEFKAC